MWLFLIALNNCCLIKFAPTSTGRGTAEADLQSNSEEEDYNSTSD